MIADCIVLYIAALNAVGWLSERAGVVATQQSQLEHSKSVKKCFCSIRVNRGVHSFSIPIFHDPKIIKSITVGGSHSQTVSDGWRQRIGCLLNVVARCLRLSAIECTVNRWF